MKLQAVFFDMDGVLVDISNSYMKAIEQTVKYFTGIQIKKDRIISYKHRGGFNDDWDLTEAIIKEEGYQVKKDKIIEKFQNLYRGDNFDGLVLNEKWLLKTNTIKWIKNRYKTGIITGRTKKNALFSLKKNKVYQYFDVHITMDDTPGAKKKPSPFGIKKAMKQLKVKTAIYAGDSVDDMRAASAAGITPIGVINPFHPFAKQKQLLNENGAKHIIEDINQIIEVINEIC